MINKIITWIKQNSNKIITWIKQNSNKITLKDVFKKDGWILTQEFGKTKYAKEHPGYYKNGVHKGLDWAGKKKGFSVRATHDGKVIWSGENEHHRGRGNYISLWDKKQEIATHSYHLNEVKVKKGDIIKAGVIIGTVGNTGFSKGVHLHVGLYRTIDGYILNPDNESCGAIDPLDPKLIRWIK